jgi:3-(3-hydroxy-phenyl)propionate hydroxylase
VLVGEMHGALPAGVRGIADPTGMLAERYDARPGTAYLFRPDQHICARWRAFDLAKVRAGIAKATGQIPVAERQVA